MLSTVELCHPVRKKMRFEWANEALRRTNGPLWSSPLDPYRLDTRPALWGPRQDIDGVICPSPLLDVFVFPPGWADLNFDEVVEALGTDFFVDTEFYGGRGFSWDPAGFLRAIETESVAFDAQTGRFKV
jgi:hypothetical protein